MDENGHDISSGTGVEQEVILYLFNQFKSQESRWFEANDNGFLLLVTFLSLAASQNISKAHMQDMAILGAIVSLRLMHGITAMPLGPLFMYFCVYEC